MVNGINMEDVKRYNAELKLYKEKAAQVKTRIEINTAEIDRLCAELSAELGVTVTRDNASDILRERTEKIMNSLKVGNEILSRIKAEEANSQNNASVQTAVPSTPQAPVQGQTQSIPWVNGFGANASQTPVNLGQMSEETLNNIPPIFGR